MVFSISIQKDLNGHMSVCVIKSDTQRNLAFASHRSATFSMFHTATL